MYRSLDSVRARLDHLADSIVGRITERSLYKFNNGIYRLPNDITGSKNESFLDRSVRLLEDYHKQLGRYTFQDQSRLTTSNGISVGVVRTPVESSIDRTIAITIKDDLFNFYKGFLSRICRSGDDPSTHGEAVECDAELILLTNERIMLGKYIAQAKMDENGSIAGITDKNELISKLRNPERENIVIARAGEVSNRYDFRDAWGMEFVIRDYFRWMIEKTLQVEVEYVMEKRKKGMESFR